VRLGARHRRCPAGHPDHPPARDDAFAARRLHYWAAARRRTRVRDRAGAARTRRHRRLPVCREVLAPAQAAADRGAAQ
jgi:hypothetical protein